MSYHIAQKGKKAGMPVLCRATVKDCPLRDSEGNKLPHFDSENEAKKYSNKRNREENTILAKNNLEISQEMYERGKKYENDKKYKSALKCYEKAAKLKGKNNSNDIYERLIKKAESEKDRLYEELLGPREGQGGLFWKKRKLLVSDKTYKGSKREKDDDNKIEKNEKRQVVLEKEIEDMKERAFPITKEHKDRIQKIYSNFKKEKNDLIKRRNEIKTQKSNSRKISDEDIKFLNDSGKLYLKLENEIGKYESEFAKSVRWKYHSNGSDDLSTKQKMRNIYKEKDDVYMNFEENINAIVKKYNIKEPMIITSNGGRQWTMERVAKITSKEIGDTQGFVF